MKFHLLSDIHLENVNINYVKHLLMPTVTGDVCFLAGDICSTNQIEKYELFIKYLQEQFNEIVFVAGNHEFYGSSYNKTIDELVDLASRTKTHFLDIETNQHTIELYGKTIHGSTLWTDFNAGKNAKDVENGINDYLAIKDISTLKIREVHERSRNAINWDADIVMTHHMPILREHSRFPLSPITYAFCCTDLEDSIINSDIKYWLYGHTHDNRFFDLNGTHVLSNHVGYDFYEIQMYNNELTLYC